ncbi:MAG TPA: hypothetical protein VGR62_07315 [Candidatus Binatia bacterium]|jgi:hypothetical protein|nr:hypothetical protein [Candidatus Binatia bacterium]
MTTVLLALLTTCLAAAPALAGTISMNISQSAELVDGSLVVKVNVSNSGDEAALAVTPVLRFRDAEIRGKGKATLEPKGTFEEELRLPAGDLTPGRWPYRLAVDYTDGNQYPFQALQSQIVLLGNPAPAKVAVPTVTAEPIAGSGDLTVTLKNLTDAEQKATVSVLVPDGLEAESKSVAATLPAWAEQKMDIAITNRAALAGSRYPVFVAVEYDDAGTHQAVVARGMVEIVGSDSFLDRNARYLWMGAVGLVVLWLGVVAARSLGRR